MLGFDAASGGGFDSPGTIYFGDSDGFGFILGDPGGSLAFELTGLPGDGANGDGAYAVSADVFGVGTVGGAAQRGTLAEGVTSSFEIPFTRYFNDRFGIANLVEFEGFTISGTNISVLINPDNTVAIGGELALDIEHAALLPDVSTPDLDGLVTVEALHGSINLNNGVLQLSADTATLTVDDIVTISANPETIGGMTLPGLSLTLDPNETSADATIATIRNLNAQFPALPGVPPDLINVDISIRRNGFDLVTEMGGPDTDVTIGADPVILDVEDLHVDAQLHVTYATTDQSILPTVLVGGHIRFDATSATLLPGSPFSASILDDDPDDSLPGLFGEIDLTNTSLKLTADRLVGSAGGLFSVDADDGTLNLGPNVGSGDAIFSVGSATITLPLLGDAQIAMTAHDINVYQDGEVTITGAEATAANGIATSLGLGGLLPFDLTRVAVGSVGQSDPISIRDFTSIDVNGISQPVDITVQGFFNFDSFDLLPFTPSIQIGGSGPQGPDNTFDVTFRQVAGQIVPWHTGTIAMGFGTAEIFPGFTVAGDLNLGGYVDGVWQTQLGGSLTALLAADTGASSLTVTISEDSTLNIATGVLDLLGTVTLDGDISGSLGGFSFNGGELPFRVLMDVDQIAVAPFFELATFEVTFGNVTIDEIVVDVADLFTITASGIEIFTDPQLGDPIGTVASLTVDVSATSVLAGLQTTITTRDVQLYQDRLKLANVELLLDGTLTVGGTALLYVDDLKVSFSDVELALGNFFDLVAGESVSISDLGSVLTLPASGIDVSLVDGILLPEPAAAGVVPAGLAELHGVHGTFTFGGAYGLPDGTLRVTADEANANVLDLFQISAVDSTLVLGPQVDNNVPILDVLTASLTLPLLDDHSVQLTAQNLAVGRDGTVSITSAGVVTPAGLGTSLGLGGLLPFDLTEVRIDSIGDEDGIPGPDPIALNVVSGGTSIGDLDITVRGQFNFSVFDGLPFTPVLQIGEDIDDDGEIDVIDSATADNQHPFDLTFHVMDLGTSSPSVRIDDVGPITLGVRDFQLGPFTVDEALLTLGGYVNGEFSTQGFGADVAISFDGDDVAFGTSVSVNTETSPLFARRAGQPESGSHGAAARCRHGRQSGCRQFGGEQFGH